MYDPNKKNPMKVIFMTNEQTIFIYAIQIRKKMLILKISNFGCIAFMPKSDINNQRE